MNVSGSGVPRLAPWLLAIACGVIVANVYYCQPLSGPIGIALGMPRESYGLIVTLSQVGYGAGLLLLVPLGDLIENRRLVVMLMAVESACLLLAASMREATAYLVVAFCVGAAAVSVQLFVPYATYIASEAQRGRVVGRVMSGLMLGIMLSRPMASLIADMASWRAVFIVSAGLTLLLLFAVIWVLPLRHPAPGLHYGALLGSMGRIWVRTPVLRRRALYQCCMYGAFSIFWTAVPLWLTGADFELTQQGVAWVALAGVAGAVAPPFASRLADSGMTRRGTGAALATAAASFALSLLAMQVSRAAGLALIVSTAITLDFAVSGNLVLGQRAIFSLDASERSRLNAIFMASFFLAGSIASALSAFCYARYGWTGVALLGMALPSAGLVYFSTERRVEASASTG